MAPLYAFFAFGIGSYLSEALSLVEKPKKAGDHQLSLPDAPAMSNGSQRVMKDLTTQVNVLQGRLNELNEKGKDSFQKQKAAFEKILSQQAYENNMLKTQNENIIVEIKNHRASSSKWRGQAENLALACSKLKQELHVLSANMTLAQEFAHQTLNKSAQMLEAPELRVLEELAKEDEASQKDKLHQSRLTDIAGEDEDKLQMLQINANMMDSPQDLLQSLVASIDKLSSQQNQSHMKLKTNFDMAYQKGVELRTSLLEQQTNLNATRVYERSLDDRLQQAAEHLSKTHNELSHKLTALRTFHARLGGESALPVYKDNVSLPHSKGDVAVKGHEQKNKMSMLSVRSANNVDQRMRKKQTMPGHEEFSAYGIENNGPPQKEMKEPSKKR